MEWKESYSCNIEIIDQQHKELIELGNQLYQIAMNKDLVEQKEQVKQVFQKLKIYTLEHFSYEEELMIAHGYKGYDLHKAEHEGFIEMLNEKVLHFGFTPSEIVDMILFFMDWIGNHIIISDQMYAKEFKLKK